MEHRLRIFSLCEKLPAALKVSFSRFHCLLILLLCVPQAKAQDSPGRFEVGGNLTVLNTAVGFQPGATAHYGPGLEGDFNFGRHFALDAAWSWFPDRTVGLRNNVTQGLFGAKVGTRTQHFGFFGKVRPGFVSIRNSLRQVTVADTFNERFARLTERAIDFGGVFEYYPSRHWALRYDMGDTVVFEEPGRLILLNAPLPAPQTFSTHTRNRFQLSTGVHYRF